MEQLVKSSVSSLTVAYRPVWRLFGPPLIIVTVLSKCEMIQALAAYEPGWQFSELWILSSEPR